MAAAEPIRAVIRLADPRDRLLLKRIRGQISDLGVSLLPAETIEIEPMLEQQKTTAMRLGLLHRADLVIWFQIQKDVELDWIRIYVASSEKQKLFRRDVKVPKKPSLKSRSISSAALEAAAVMVRTAILGHIIKKQAAVPPPQRKKPTTQPTTRPTTQPTTRPTKPPSKMIHLLVFGGWQMVLDGLTSAPHGFSFAALLHLWSLELGLQGSSSLPSSVFDQRATLRLSRHSVGLVIGYHQTWDTLGFQMTASAQAGVTFFQRRTIDPSPGVTPTEDQLSVSLLLGPQLSFGWAPPILGKRLSFPLGAGLDVVPWAPSLIFQEATLNESRGSSYKYWKAQPRFTLVLQLMLI